MNHVVYETPHGPKISGTRITVYDIYYYMLRNWHHTAIAAQFNMSSEEVLGVMKYIEEHREQVHAVHLDIEERNARGNPPEVQAILDEIHAKYAPLWEERKKRYPLEPNDEGDNGRRQHSKTVADSARPPGQ